MIPFAWFRVSRFRRVTALATIAAALAGIVLVRASHAGRLSNGPLPFTAVEATPTTISFSGEGLSGTFALSHGSIAKQSPSSLFADIRLKASDATAKERAPLSMAIVLDTSGSMSGEKIDRAKKSVIRMIREMRDEDEVAFVRYSDQAELMQPLARVSSVRESLIRRVDGLRADGGTFIAGGLTSAKSALSQVAKGRVRRVALVSDGLDGSRAQSHQIASGLAESGVTTSALGIGLDFDEAYMSDVASAGHGNFAFVERGEGLENFLRKELVEASTTVVEQAEVRFTIPSGLRLVRGFGGDARAEGSEVVVRAGSLFAGDERRILLELVPTFEAGSPPIVFAPRVAWQRVGKTRETVNADSLRVQWVDDAATASRSVNGEVFARAMSVVASDRQLQAATAFGHGDGRRAQALARQNEADLKAAMAVAPPAATAAITKQLDQYVIDESVFRSGVSGSSAEGSQKVKNIYQRDSTNKSRAGTF